MDLINWSLSAIDTIFSTRSLGSGEPVCPDGTFAAGYTRDAWERWQIVCLAALSVEDAEDIYLYLSKAVFFLNTLSSCSVYPTVICMLCMYGQVDG